MKKLALMLAVLVSACGGGGDSPQEVKQAPAQAAPVACQDIRTHETGTVVYVTVERDCEPALTQRVTHDGQSVAITFSAVGVDQSVTLGGEEHTVALVHRGTWRSFANLNSWAWRDGAGLLPKDGGLYLLGGWNSETGSNSEVWFTKDLANWTLLTHAPWPGRHGAGWVVHNDRLYVVSGDYTTDAWSSADGVNWTQHTADGGFGALYAPNVASFNGELLLFNGMKMEDGSGNPEVWSSPDGESWTNVATVPYKPRGLIHGSVVHKGRLYTIAGGLKGWDILEDHNDIWSTADGRDWRLETDNAGFTRRSHHAALGTEHGCYVANGSVEGVQLNTTSEVYFAPDCIHFALLKEQPAMKGGVHATSLAEFNGSIVLLGGHGSVVGSTVWQYFPE